MQSCRACGHSLSEPFLSLGNSPLSNAYLTGEQLSRLEPTYPLDVYVCGSCRLMQLDVFERAEKIFSHEYAYFSSFSETWLEHCQRYTEAIVSRLALNTKSFVVEIASNDGYLLQYFVERGIPALGIEPAYPCAFEALKRGVPTEAAYFTTDYANQLVAKRGCADLIVGNNVLAHNPGVNDFVNGMRILLAEGGVITMEFPHAMRMLDKNEFDTIYHEHFSYITLHAASALFERNGLTIFDAEELPTHGGSLRIYAAHKDDKGHQVTEAVQGLLSREEAEGLFNNSTYVDFAQRVRKVKRDLLKFMIEAKEEGKHIAGYGAPAKGNTLLNYCGIRTDFIDFTVDRSPFKQGMFLPGSHIPIFGPDKLKECKPDYVFILPWNIKEEVMAQTSYIREWGGRWFVAIPELELLSP